MARLAVSTSVAVGRAANIIERKTAMGEKGEKVGGEPLARGCRPAPDERLRGGRSRSDGRQVADDATSKKTTRTPGCRGGGEEPVGRKGGESARAANCQAAAIHPAAEAAAREVWYLLSCGTDPPRPSPGS